MIVRARALAEGTRNSLFFIPGLCVVAAAALAQAMLALDRQVELEAVPSGAAVHSGERPGTAGDHHCDREVNKAFAVGPSRTMQQDVAFGIRQLVDVALRALSPGVNDPTTAHECIVHLCAILYEVLRRDVPLPESAGELP